MKRTATATATTARTATATTALEMTCSRFAALMSCDRHQLTKRIAEMRIEATGKKNGGKVYRLKDLVLAFAGGDIEAERLRKTRAESERIELQNSRSRGELVEVSAVKKLGEKVMVAIRSTILNFNLTDDEKDKCLLELLALGKLDWSRDA